MNHDFIDCTTLLTPALVTWPGDEKFRRMVRTTVPTDGVEVSVFTLNAHHGTHMDAPRHFLASGTGVDAVPLSVLIGPAVVVEVNNAATEILPEHLAPINWHNTERIFFRTANSTRRLLDDPQFHEDYVALSLPAAELLLQHGIKLVGIDYLSIERKGNPGHPVHTALLQNGLVIVEGVVLAHVAAGRYMCTALPLRIADADGSPCRVILQRI